MLIMGDWFLGRLQEVWNYRGGMGGKVENNDIAVGNGSVKKVPPG